jgi:glycine cleavage system H protein
MTWWIFFCHLILLSKRFKTNEKYHVSIIMANEVREDLKYTRTHEWVKLAGTKAKIGITDHAQGELTDIVFVELPTVGKEVKKGEELCVVESVKSVSEVYAPVSGKVVAVNTKLDDSPEVINSSPYDDGWLVELELKDKAEVNTLLDSAAYKKL